MRMMPPDLGFGTMARWSHGMDIKNPGNMDSKY
jgi:hypothetical protein